MAGAVVECPGQRLAGQSRFLAGLTADSPAGSGGGPWRRGSRADGHRQQGQDHGGPWRRGSRWRSRKARASQYMAAPGRTRRDCRNSSAGTGTSPPPAFTLVLAGRACSPSAKAATGDAAPAATPPGIPDSSAPSARRGPRPTLMGWKAIGFWLRNSVRMRRYRPERKDPGGGSLDSSAGRRTNPGDGPGTAAPGSTSSREPHWWQYE